MDDDQSPAAPAVAKKSNAVTGRCSKAGMQQHKAALAAAAAAEEEEEDEGRREAILNPAHLDAVATAAQATDGQFGYEHLEEPLSLFDFHRCGLLPLAPRGTCAAQQDAVHACAAQQHVHETAKGAACKLQTISNYIEDEPAGAAGASELLCLHCASKSCMRSCSHPRHCTVVRLVTAGMQTGPSAATSMVP